MKAEHTTQLPKYLRVKQALRERISQGEFAADGYLPTEPELMRTFRVGRQTVIRAMNDLRAEGLITRHRGKGTLLSPDVP
jgi:GntR family transcriptional regulator